MNDPTRLFAGYLEFQIDYSKPLDGGSNGSWTLVNNWAGGMGPSDLETYQPLWFVGTFGNGKTYATYSSRMTANQSFRDVYELTSSGRRFTGQTIQLVTPYTVDKDFNITSLVGGGFGQGDVGHLTKNSFIGFDGSSNPTWQFTSWDTATWTLILTSETLPALFPPWELGNQNPLSVAPLGNGIIPFYNTHSTNPPFATYNHLGGVDSSSGLVRFNTHFAAPDNNGYPTMYTTVFPESPYFARGNIGDFGGGFMAYRPGDSTLFTLFRGEAWNANQCNVYDHWHESGLPLYRFGPPLPYFGAPSLQNPPPATVPPGTVMTPSTPNENQVTPGTARANFKGSPGAAGNAAWGDIADVNGNYYLYNADEWYHAGVHRWKVSNRGSLSGIDYPTVFSGSVTPIVDPTDHLAGLPYDSFDVPTPVAGWTRNFSNTGTNIAAPPYIALTTNNIACNPHESPDITLAAAFASPSTVDNSAARTLTRSGSGNWYLDSKIYVAPVPGQFFWIANPNNRSSIIACEILDNTGKIIVKIFPGLVQDYGPNSPLFSLSLWVNDTFTPLINPTFTTDQSGTHTDQAGWYQAYTGAVRTLRIEGTPGQVKLIYDGTHILTTSATQDFGANILAPTIFRLRYFVPGGFTGLNGGGGALISVTKLNFGDL
jgi:hypothetical protein